MEPGGIPVILVVEDDNNLLGGICDILEAADFKVLSASHGQEALDVMHNTATLPSLIVSDIGMPIMDGYELLEAVRQERDWVEIPFVFLTAFTESHQVRRGMVAGVDDYLTKPFTPEDLVLAIKAKLRRRAQVSSAHAAQIRKLKRDILTIINHEFRTPLTPVIAYADMLKREIATLRPDELEVFVSGINSGAERLRTLVEDLILLVELETGEAQHEFEIRRTQIHDIGSVLMEIASRMSDMAAAKGLTIYIDDIPEQMPVFYADPEYLQSAIQRLVHNAIKFTDEPGNNIILRADHNRNGISIQVEDRGRGIPAKHLEEIFEPFFQINREHFEDQGIGSGLAIVKGIVALHNGTVTVESELGVGTVFTVDLPIN